jgi:ABC-type polar amino acid transport system ATPase subunit
MKERRAIAKRLRIKPELMGFGEAMRALRPDLEAKVWADDLSFEDVMPDLVQAYDDLVCRILRREAAS